MPNQWYGQSRSAYPLIQSSLGSVLFQPASRRCPYYLITVRRHAQNARQLGSPLCVATLKLVPAGGAARESSDRGERPHPRLWNPVGALFTGSCRLMMKPLSRSIILGGLARPFVLDDPEMHETLGSVESRTLFPFTWKRNMGTESGIANVTHPRLVKIESRSRAPFLAGISVKLRALSTV